MARHIHHLNISPSNIWNLAQNKPSLILDDLRRIGVDNEDAATILIARGVTKWLACHRDIIKLKDVIKKELSSLYEQIGNRSILRGTDEYLIAKGRMKALEEVRASLRGICHSPRLRSPDNDTRFNKIFTSLTRKPTHVTK